MAQFRGYQSDEGSDLLTAIPTGGASDGSITPDNLCDEGFDGQPYTDFFLGAHGISFATRLSEAQLFNPQSRPTSRPAYIIAHSMMTVNQFASKGLAVPSRLARSMQLPIVSRCAAISTTSPRVDVSAASLQDTCNVSSLVRTFLNTNADFRQ